MESFPTNKYRTYKLVLTGGPCGGKTTGQERLATFFEDIGWKVFTVPETATVLLRGGVKFSELNSDQMYQFQKDLLLTLLQIEKVFFDQASLITDRNVLIICDRGAMDPSAYMETEGWNRILKDSNLNAFDLRDNRYNQIVHLVTAADGAKSYYTLKNNCARSEDIDQAKDQDLMTRNAWVGHPYVDIIDNTDFRSFNDKILQVIQVVCDRISIPYHDRFAKNSKKRKWLIKTINQELFTKYEEFSVRHDYLLSVEPNVQVRIRKRCQNNRSTYTFTKRLKVEGELVETKTQLNEREYNGWLNVKDKSRAAVFKKRRCFNFGLQFFNLDIFVDPLPPACYGKGLMILETYTTKPCGDFEPKLPDFLEVDREITGNFKFSMHKLAEMGANPVLNEIDNY